MDPPHTPSQNSSQIYATGGCRDVSCSLIALNIHLFYALYEHLQRVVEIYVDTDRLCLCDGQRRDEHQQA